jgi:hypothetical protein
MQRASVARSSSSGSSRQVLPRGPIWLLAIAGALQLAGCGDAAEGDDGFFEALCPEAGSSVVIRNGTGKPIREVQIRSLDEAADPYSLTTEIGLPVGGEVIWQACSAQPQALIVTFDDGTVEQSELPSLVPNTRRLTLAPGTSKPSDPPSPSRPPSRQLDSDAIGGTGIPTMAR